MHLSDAELCLYLLELVSLLHLYAFFAACVKKFSSQHRANNETNASNGMILLDLYFITLLPSCHLQRISKNYCSKSVTKAIAGLVDPWSVVHSLKRIVNERIWKGW